MKIRWNIKSTSAACIQTVLMVIALFLPSCASTHQRAEIIRENDDQRFKVTVTADGQKVKNFGETLVHRVDIPETAVNVMVQSWPDSFTRLAQTHTEYDAQGKVMGLRVISPQPGAKIGIIGVLDRDIITAVGLTPIRSRDQIQSMFAELKKTGLATLTVERGGVPHKYLYYIRR